MGHKFLAFYKEEKEKGFIRKVPRVEGEKINVGELDELYRRTCQASESEKTLDLAALGYSKLLGSGSVSKAYVVKVASYSEKARMKIEAKGGRIVKLGEF